MNKVVTSKEEILKVSRKLIMEQGWKSVNIRAVAASCGVAVGSIYNYFFSKSDLMTATVESVWYDIFHFSEEEDKDADFEECIRWLFRRMEEGAEKYPGFFTFHSMSFLVEEKTKAHEKKERSWQYIKKGLYTVLEKDKRVCRDAFNEQFTREKFVDVIFSMMLAFMLQQAYDSSVVVEIVRRSIYD